MNPDDPRHGTVIGYNQHRRDGEDACEPCKRGAARYQATRENEKAHGITRSIDPRGVQRRLRALQRIGWPSHALAEWLGWNTAETVNRLFSVQFVYRSTHEQIVALYDALSGTPGPSPITRKRAEQAGHPAPLAWDDIDNDEHPQGHEVCRTDDCAGEVEARGLCGTCYDRDMRDRKRSA